MTTDIKAAVLRNELAIIIGCLDGRSAHEKAESVIAWMDKYDQRATIQSVAAAEPTLQDWLTIIHDNELSLGDRLQRLSVQMIGILRGDAPDKYKPHTIREQCHCALDYERALADHRRLVRELDVLLNGEEGAADQASLRDIVAQVQREGVKAAPAQAATDEVRDAKLYGFDREELEAIADGLESGYDKSVNVGGSPLAGCDDNRINTTTMDASKFIRAALRTTSTDSEKGGA